jgi:hypothetical protein
MKGGTSSGRRAIGRVVRFTCAAASIGYISQGSVVDRSTLRPPRSGYQWTRKVAQKAITVALSPEEFLTIGKAIQNRRKLAKILTNMENISRRLFFNSLPDTHRRKPLNTKVCALFKRHSELTFFFHFGSG